MILYIDGGCSGNQFIDKNKVKMISVVSDEQGNVLSEENNIGGSNNIAELIAVKNALSYCFKEGILDVEIRTDSRNNIAWVYGNVGKKLVDKELVLKIKEHIIELLKSIKLKLVWIPREENIAGHYIENKYSL
jgi:ribonuclease HI